MPRRVSKTGFTLIELMVTVAIIGIAMAVALPTIAGAMRDRRVQQAAINLMDPFRIARTRAMMRGAAHVAVIVRNGSGLDGFVFEGSNSSCRLSNWGTAIVPATTPMTGPWAVFQTPALNPTDSIAEDVTNPAGLNALQVCYTPGGRAFYRFAPSAPWADGNSLPGVGGGSLDGGFMFRVYGATGGHTTRNVFVPLGGSPRLWQ